MEKERAMTNEAREEQAGRAFLRGTIMRLADEAGEQFMEGSDTVQAVEAYAAAVAGTWATREDIAAMARAMACYAVHGDGFSKAEDMEQLAGIMEHLAGGLSNSKTLCECAEFLRRLADELKKGGRA